MTNCKHCHEHIQRLGARWVRVSTGGRKCPANPVGFGGHHPALEFSSLETNSSDECRCESRPPHNHLQVADSGLIGLAGEPRITGHGGDANDRLVSQFLETRITDPETGGQKGSKAARFDLLPWDVLTELAEHYGKGEKKYPSPDPTTMNWQLGYNWRLSFAALQRHLTAWWMGEDVDEETGSSHLTAVIWHACALRWFQIHEKGTDTR